MQTFLTDYPALSYGFEYLDRRRLVKQLLETRQIMAALAGTTRGWVNHPATRMWQGKETMLFDYAIQNARELQARSYKWENNLDYLTEHYNLIVEMRDTNGQFNDDDYKRIMYTHRGRLYEKDSAYYAQWSNFSDFRQYTCCERCSYYWPTHIWETV